MLPHGCIVALRLANDVFLALVSSSKLQRRQPTELSVQFPKKVPFAYTCSSVGWSCMHMLISTTLLNREVHAHCSHRKL
jgi:hypothetical protein